MVFIRRPCFLNIPGVRRRGTDADVFYSSTSELHLERCFPNIADICTDGSVRPAVRCPTAYLCAPNDVHEGNKKLSSSALYGSAEPFSTRVASNFQTTQPADDVDNVSRPGAATAKPARPHT